MADEERGIVVAGSGWAAAGMLALVLCVYEGSAGLFAVGILALSIGIWIVFARKRIVRFRDEILKRRKRAGG